jgi:hypothetical protein
LRRLALGPALLSAISIFTLQFAQGQTFTVIHSFEGPDGYVPSAGLTMDRAGNFYGTTRDGGSFNNGPFCSVYAEIGCGTVFKLSRHGSDWQLSPIFLFDGPDGAYPTTPCDNRAEWDRLRYHFGGWPLLFVSLWLRCSF